MINTEQVVGRRNKHRNKQNKLSSSADTRARHWASKWETSEQQEILTKQTNPATSSLTSHIADLAESEQAISGKVYISAVVFIPRSEPKEICLACHAICKSWSHVSFPKGRPANWPPGQAPAAFNCPIGKAKGQLTHSLLSPANMTWLIIEKS